MPVKRRVGKGRRLDDHRLEQLMDGPDSCLLAGCGYLHVGTVGMFKGFTHDEKEQVLTAMREDWVIHGAAILANCGDVRPWALEQFEGRNH